MSWKIVYTPSALRDAKKLSQAGLKETAKRLLSLLEEDPFRTPPRYEKLVGDLSGAYSRRISLKHRLACQVLKEEHVVKVLRMWTHYE